MGRRLGAPGSGPGLAATWDTLTCLMDLHMAAEDEICGPVVYDPTPSGAALARSVRDAHEDIREIIGETSLQIPGSPRWSDLADTALDAWARQVDYEEHGLLAACRRRAGPVLRAALARQWRAFREASIRDQSYPDAPPQLPTTTRAAPERQVSTREVAARPGQDRHDPASWRAAAPAGAPVLRVRRSHSGGEAVVSLAGELDLTNADAVRAAVARCLRRRPTRLQIDLAGLHFCGPGRLATTATDLAAQPDARLVTPADPSPEMVAAARRQLTGQYARGAERLLWERDKQPVPDLAAVRRAAAAGAGADPAASTAALVLVQAARLGLDRLEHDVFQAAHAAGISPGVVAAALDLPDAQAAAAREQWLAGRRALPYEEPESARRGVPGDRPRRRPGPAAGPGRQPPARRRSGSAGAGSAPSPGSRASRPGRTPSDPPRTLPKHACWPAKRRSGRCWACSVAVDRAGLRWRASPSPGFAAVAAPGAGGIQIVIIACRPAWPRSALSRDNGRAVQQVLGGHLGPCHVAGTVAWLDAILRSSGTERGLAVGYRKVPAGTLVPVIEFAEVAGDLVLTLAHPAGPEVQACRLCDTFTHRGAAWAVLAPWPRGERPKQVVGLAPSAVRCLDTATFDEVALAHLSTRARYRRPGPHPTFGEESPDPRLAQCLGPPGNQFRPPRQGS